MAPHGALAFGLAQDTQQRRQLDLALMTPSCCEAPDGLAHYWDLPTRLGEMVSGFYPAPPFLDSS